MSNYHGNHLLVCVTILLSEHLQVDKEVYESHTDTHICTHKHAQVQSQTNYTNIPEHSMVEKDGIESRQRSSEVRGCIQGDDAHERMKERRERKENKEREVERGKQEKKIDRERERGREGGRENRKEGRILQKTQWR